MKSFILFFFWVGEIQSACEIEIGLEPRLVNCRALKLNETSQRWLHSSENFLVIRQWKGEIFRLNSRSVAVATEIVY